eukprot:6200867-Pleurochrysis_carterae.AAC.1
MRSARQPENRNRKSKSNKGQEGEGKEVLKSERVVRIETTKARGSETKRTRARAVKSGRERSRAVENGWRGRCGREVAGGSEGGREYVCVCVCEKERLRRRSAPKPMALACQTVYEKELKPTGERASRRREVKHEERDLWPRAKQPQTGSVRGRLAHLSMPHTK